ncbi:hypothetical protein, partial [Limnofasciculus baicalensis]
GVGCCGVWGVGETIFLLQPSSFSLHPSPTTPFVILIAVFVLSNWLFSEFFVFFPLDIVSAVKPITSLTIAIALIIFGWCLGE